MNITIYDVANGFLTKGPMSHKKLQKLCYYAYAWNWALNNQPLVKSDFEAWIHGPVCSQLYNYYRGFGWNDIPQQSCLPKSIDENEMVKDLINEIYRIYGDFSGDELELITHSELPWIEAREDLQPWDISTNKISEATMASFYLNLLQSESNV